LDVGKDEGERRNFIKLIKFEGFMDYLIEGSLGVWAVLFLPFLRKMLPLRHVKCGPIL